jgi:signal transduction histidine kinase
MNVSQNLEEQEKLSPATARRVHENLDLIAQASAEIRTVSYLLHPPMLEELGLRFALQSYTDGFAERSKIPVELQIDSHLGRLPQDYELSIFRVVQECLTNVHRHSGSPTASIRLSRTPKEVRLEVRDSGTGIKEQLRSSIASGASAGVGFRGMQERVKTLGGTLTVQSDENGTSVLVVLPPVGEAQA